VVPGGAGIRNMTLPPNIPAATPEQRFRLVVKARTSGVRAYIWEIIRDDITGQRERIHRREAAAAGREASPMRLLLTYSVRAALY
jgi:hypothetical protein